MEREKESWIEDDARDEARRIAEDTPPPDDEKPRKLSKSELLYQLISETSLANRNLIVQFLNSASTASNISNFIRDAPHYGSPEGYGIGPTVAQRILDKRTRLSGSKYTDLTQLANIKGLGKDKIFDLVYSVPLTRESALPQQVKEKLTGYLQEISTGWVQESVDSANNILSNTSYEAETWKYFFGEYFNTNPYTDDLSNYLGYPVFSWFSEETHLNLQNGLVDSMMDNINRVMQNYHEKLSEALVNNPAIFQTLMNSHRFLNDIAKVGIVSDETKFKIYVFYIDLVNSYPNLLKKGITFDTNIQLFQAVIKAQTWMNLRDMIAQNQIRKQEIAETLGLDGRYLDIWSEFSVMVIDNNGFDNRQLEVIFDLLSKIPKTLHELGTITCNELLGNIGDRYQRFNAKSSVNIFGINVGVQRENGFPNDVDPIYSDIFALVLVHEVNHAVDFHLHNTDESYRARKSSIITRAGYESTNYLRSMFENNFFMEAPQEFFASISNQWFSDTFHTLDLAVARFQKGYREPINQFLFFADTFSEGGEQTLFYTLSTEGNINQTIVPIRRDIHGYIKSLDFNGTRYTFILDELGYVINITRALQ